MTPGKNHISLCICTFKRQHLLKRLLNSLVEQQTGGVFTFSVVVTDNDRARSAETAVLDFMADAQIPVKYCVEPRQNIALARNKAVANATGDFIAFIDDDEYPAPEWLLTLFKTCIATGAAGVLGPVVPQFEQVPPRWATKGGLFERPTYETGYLLNWWQTRTGNVLFRREITAGADPPFNSKFGTGGEDEDFFRRMMTKGYRFVWCNEAVVYESVPPARCTRAYLLKRALLCGGISFKSGYRNRFKSFIAVPLYALALPFLFMAGEHHFMRYMIKFCDHAGLLLALFRMNPMTKRDF